MEFSELIARRYSVRAYGPQAVEDEKLQQVLEAARLAPTAANRQPFRIVVIRVAGRLAELRRLYDRDWFTQAPLVLAMCVDHRQAWTRSDGKNYGDVDAAIAMDHLILAAANLGLGTCWVAAFDPAVAREILALPDGVEAVAFTPLGYPLDEPKPKTRKPLSEIVSYERW